MPLERKIEGFTIGLSPDGTERHNKAYLPKAGLVESTDCVAHSKAV